METTQKTREPHGAIELFIKEKTLLQYDLIDIFNLLKAEFPVDHISKTRVSQIQLSLGLRPRYEKRGRPRKGGAM
jgi:hypothetical protein